MSFLFKSKKEREREERRERRKAFRQAENAVDSVKDRIASMSKESDKEWEAAKAALKEGEKQKAQRLLTSYRGKQVLITKLEQKRWVFEQYLVKMEAAQSDKDFAVALSGINQVMEIDPDAVADIFESSQDILAEQVDTDRFWEKLYTKESAGAEGNLEDYVPSLDELSRQLEEEAVGSVGDISGAVDSELEKRISQGQKRVKDLLDDKE